MNRSSDYEMGKVVMMGWALDFRSADGGQKSLSILKAGLLIRGYLSISGWAM
jgi:hypothetical protein